VEQFIHSVSQSVSRSVSQSVTKLYVLKNKSVEIRAYINVRSLRHRWHTVLLFINIQLNTLIIIYTPCYFMSQCFQHVSAHTEPSSWRRKQGNASYAYLQLRYRALHVLLFFIHSVTASDIVCIYSVRVIQY